MPVDAYCKGCQYHATNSYGKWCNFYDVTGVLRGCPSGNGCFRYAKGSVKRTPNAAAYEHKIPEKKAKAKEKTTPAPKKEKKPPMTLEEAYEKDRNRKREAAAKYRAHAQGRQTAAIDAYKKAHGLTNVQLAEIVGVNKSVMWRWATEYTPANWDKLAVIGIEKPPGL